MDQPLNPWVLILPAFLTEHFSITHTIQTDQGISVMLEERNEPPAHCLPLQSKGFFDPLTLQDFPLRGKPVFLIVRRRRWRDPNTGKEVSHPWTFTASGTHYTQDFANFLKDLDRDGADLYRLHRAVLFGQPPQP